MRSRLSQAFFCQARRYSCSYFATIKPFSARGSIRVGTICSRGPVIAVLVMLSMILTLSVLFPGITERAIVGVLSGGGILAIIAAIGARLFEPGSRRQSGGGSLLSGGIRHVVRSRSCCSVGATLCWFASVGTAQPRLAHRPARLSHRRGGGGLVLVRIVRLAIIGA